MYIFNRLNCKPIVHVGRFIIGESNKIIVKQFYYILIPFVEVLRILREKYLKNMTFSHNMLYTI